MTARFEPAANLNEILDDVTAKDRAGAAKLITKKAGQNVDTDSGHYARTLRVTVDDRGVVAEAMDIAGHIIEWGSIHHPPQSPMRRAAADVGRFDPA